MISWGVFGMLLNLATTSHTYKIVYYPLTICLAYLILYCILGYFNNFVEIQMQVLDKDNIPDGIPDLDMEKENTSILLCDQPKEVNKREGISPHQRRRIIDSVKCPTLVNGSLNTSGCLC